MSALMVGYLLLLHLGKVQVLLQAGKHSVGGRLKMFRLYSLFVVPDCKNGGLVAQISEVSSTEAVG